MVYSADMSQTQEVDRSQALESAKKIIESRVNLFGVAEPTIQSAVTPQDHRIIVELPGIQNIDQAVSLIGQTARLDFRKFKEPLATDSASIPSLENTESTQVTGRDMQRFYVTFNTQDGSPAIGFDTTGEGRDKFAAVTKSLIGKPLIAFLDSEPISLAYVQQEIIGQGQITGQFTVKDAKNLTSLFNAGSLPVPLKLIEQRNIGATLGQDSIQKSIQGGLVGLSLVAFFMIAYYGRWGIISLIGLIIYALFSLTLYRLIPVTLTLPGVAGLLLSIGMAVDSNILIFERMKEELQAGKPLKSAMELGFGRAWGSIKDANIATLITTFILFNPLNWSFLNISGPIRGFALTLFLGIIVSLFTGILITRTLMRIFIK